jgi:HlyD family secretion protein
VKQGDVLFVLDATAQIYALEQLELTLVQKEMALQQLSDGAGEEAVRQAKNAVVIAQATYDKAAEDHRSASALYAEGAIPRTVLDAAVYQMNVAAAQLDSARQQVQSIASGAGDAALEAARAAVGQTESQIRQLQETIQKYKISAEVDGVVVSRNYGVGDMVAPGYDLMEIAADEEVFVIAYLPVDRVPELDHGQMLSVEGSGYNALATVVFIDVKAQYTPKDMQSAATKNRDSVKLRLRLPSDVDFQPGETVTVIIPRSIDPYKLPS